MKHDVFSIKFWGVRGSLVTSGSEFQKVGGNTICVEIQCGHRVIVFDAGTGIRHLGNYLTDQGTPQHLDLFFTHMHYDHIAGLPFFAPLLDPEYAINVWMGSLDGAESVESAFCGVLRNPFSPMNADCFAAQTNFFEVAPNDKLQLGDGISLRTAPLNHPGGAIGYRIDYCGHSFAFVTDTENSPGKHDRSVLDLIDRVDLFAYDASFCDHELCNFAGFGHSTWEEALRLKNLSGSERVLGLHHMPYRTDADIDEIDSKMGSGNRGSGMAYEGMTVRL